MQIVLGRRRTSNNESFNVTQQISPSNNAQQINTNMRRGIKRYDDNSMPSQNSFDQQSDELIKQTT